MKTASPWEHYALDLPSVYCAIHHEPGFIQQIHAAAGNSSGWRRRPCRSSKERRARLTLSAMAERVIFPSQALTISAGDMPWASSSRICHTMMRVPLNVGLPWQISGSATMCSPSSRRLGLPFALVFISLHWSFVWPSVVCKHVVKTWSADPEKPEVRTDGVTQTAANDNNSLRSIRYFDVADQCRRVHFAIHHEPCFIGALGRRFSRAACHRRAEHSDQSYLRHTAVLPVKPVINRI